METKNTKEIEEMAIFMHQAFQRAKPHDYHKPFEETDTEYKLVMKSIAGEIIENKNNQLQKTREEEREACAVTVWSYLATFEDCLEPTQRTNALIQAIRLIRDRKTDHSELDQNTTK